MVIDFHTHTFPEKIAVAAVKELSEKAHILPHTKATNDELVSSMKESGIDLAVVLPVATSPKQVTKVNDGAVRVHEAYDCLHSFACIHPEFADYRAELARVARLGLKGVKLHPVYQETDIDDIRFLRIIERAAEVGLVVITHGGLDIGFPGKDHCSPKKIRHVVDELGDFPFVAAHMGGWRQWREVIDLLAETKVYLDTSFSTGEIEPLSDGYWDGKDLSMLTEDGFLKMVRIFGAKRILFGTDSPWTGQKQALSYVKALPLTGEERQAILGANAAALLGIPHSPEVAGKEP